MLWVQLSGGGRREIFHTFPTNVIWWISAGSQDKADDEWIACPVYRKCCRLRGKEGAATDTSTIFLELLHWASPNIWLLVQRAEGLSLVLWHPNHESDNSKIKPFYLGMFSFLAPVIEDPGLLLIILVQFQEIRHLIRVFMAAKRINWMFLFWTLIPTPTIIILMKAEIWSSTSSSSKFLSMSFSQEKHAH